MRLTIRAAGVVLTVLTGCAARLAGVEASAAVVDQGIQPWLQTGADGRGVVAYRHQMFPPAAGLVPRGELWVARCVDAACSALTTSVVDASGDVGYRPAMTIAPDGRPVVSYIDRNSHSLKVAFCGDAACTTSQIVVLDADVGVSQNLEGGRTGIAFGGDGRVLVAYTDLEPGPPPPPLSFNDRVKIVHCDDASCATRTTTDIADAVGNLPVVLGVGGDGRGFVLWHRIVGGSALLTRGHCSDAACTSVPFITDAPGPAFSGMPSLAFQANGLPAYLSADTPLVGTGGTLRYVRCQDAACSSLAEQTIDGVSGPTALTLSDGSFPRFVGNVPTAFGTQIALFQCLDAACATREVSCVAAQRSEPSLAADDRGQPVVAFVRFNQPHVEIRRLALPGPAACAPETWVEDGSVGEGTPPGAFSAQILVRTAPPATAPVVVTYQTVDGSALAGSDYVARSGTVTMDAGSGFIDVPIVPDAVPEAHEFFALQLTAVVGSDLVGDRGFWRINNDDGLPPTPPTVSVTGCAILEGHGGTSACTFQVALSAVSAQAVTVQFATQDGTAAAGADYVAQAGVLTFAPGLQMQPVPVAVIGDLLPEPHERFAVVLSNPQNALPGTMSADGQIVEDDVASTSRVEVGHGTRLLGDLAEGPDLYRLAQAPFSSWEAIVDGASGDVLPELLLERLAEDGSTVLQTAVATGTGSALALRWQHRGALPELRQQLRLRSAACGSACGPDDTYRLRVYETTARIARFNTVNSQATLVLLQNMGDTPASATLDFWNGAGSLRLSHPVKLGPLQLLVLDTDVLPALAATSGTITVTHEAAYGAIVGKSAALDPATAFVFDSPLENRPR